MPSRLRSARRARALALRARTRSSRACANRTSMSSTSVLSRAAGFEALLSDAEAAFEGVDRRLSRSDKLARLEHSVKRTRHLEPEGVPDGLIVLLGGLGVGFSGFSSRLVFPARVERNRDQAPGVEIVHVGHIVEIQRRRIGALVENAAEPQHRDCPCGCSWTWD